MRREFISGAFGIGAFFLGLYCIAMDERWALALFWARDGESNLHEAALHGSSHYDLPGILRWFTANIDVHHVHHLCSRINFLSATTSPPRLFRALWRGPAHTMESFCCVRLALWDEGRRCLISFHEMDWCYAIHRNSVLDGRESQLPSAGP
jgi:fatty acid desaturase